MFDNSQTPHTSPFDILERRVDDIADAVQEVYVLARRLVGHNYDNGGPTPKGEAKSPFATVEGNPLVDKVAIQSDRLAMLAKSLRDELERVNARL